MGYSKNKITCEDCGTSINVLDTVCPYAMEANKKYIQTHLCNSCYQERLNDANIPEQD